MNSNYAAHVSAVSQLVRLQAERRLPQWLQRMDLKLPQLELVSVRSSCYTRGPNRLDWRRRALTVIDSCSQKGQRREKLEGISAIRGLLTDLLLFMLQSEAFLFKAQSLSGGLRSRYRPFNICHSWCSAVTFLHTDALVFTFSMKDKYYLL